MRLPPRRIPEQPAEEIVQMLKTLKSVAAPYKRPSAKKIAGDMTLYAVKSGVRAVTTG